MNDPKQASRTLASFRDAHAGGSIIVCACGESLNTLTNPERHVTIGVNDVGRKFQPDYLVVVDPREAFKDDRFHYVATSRAGVFFTQRTDLAIDHPNIVRFRLGAKDGTDFSDPGALNYSVTTPYVALCLAVHMGAANIGLIGVDFTDNHFFAPTGAHPWAPLVATIDAQFDRLCRAAFARGVRVFNLSARSRLTALPKMDVETFATLPARAPGHDTRPYRIVSYATTPVVGVPAVLARCINARTPHLARCVWAADGYGNGASWTGDITWTSAPARAIAELEMADAVIVHNGKVDARHRAVLAGKPVVTMAHNCLWNVDDSLVRAGFPGVVVGQYQAALPEFQGWTAVPNPVAVWEVAPAGVGKPDELTIAYTPAGTHGVYPRDHRLYWHGKGYDETMRVLDGLAARHPVRLEVLRGQFVPHAAAMAMKQRAHIVIDECVTGSYHRSSLEGLAAGCVVVNGVGSLPGVEEVLRHCAGGAANPFIGADLTCLDSILDMLIGLGPEALAAAGASNRTWMERHWDFAAQWERFWAPAIDAAMCAARSRRGTRRAPAGASASRPEVSIVIASRNEGAFLRRTVEWFATVLPPGSEIIVVDDGSTDASAAFLDTGRENVVCVRHALPLGTAKARNAGAGLAAGRILLFSDAHTAVPAGAVTALVAALADPEVGACGPAIRAMRFPDDYARETTEADSAPRGLGCKWSGAGLRTAWLTGSRAEPHDVPLLSGALMAVRRTVFAAIGGFDRGLTEGGLEDAELCLRLWRLGYRCLVVPGADVAHHFRPERTWPLGSEAVLTNKLRLAALHFGAARQRRVTGAAGAAAAEILARLETGDTPARRDDLRALCLNDDDWFFQHFAADPMPDLTWPDDEPADRIGQGAAPPGPSLSYSC